MATSDHRCRCRKRLYRSRTQAANALLTCRTRAALQEGSNRHERRYYRCPDARGWHLTSQPDRSESAA